MKVFSSSNFFLTVGQDTCGTAVMQRLFTLDQAEKQNNLYEQMLKSI